MTHLPKSELVGVLSPSSINPRDVGKNWYDIGTISTANFITNIGNGIAIAGDGAGHIYRSTDYGNKWTDTGSISGGAFLSAVYLGNGIVLAGDSAGHIFRNINFGNNGTSGSPTGEWVDQGAITAAGAYIPAMSYLGNGIVIIGASDGHIFRHTDFGDTSVSAWTDLGGITGTVNRKSIYLENGIALMLTINGRIWRSIDFGATWADLGVITPVTINDEFTYCGNGIVIVSTSIAVLRSNNFGLTWATLPAFGTSTGRGLEYLGDGVIILGGADGHIFRSTDFGITFTDLGAISANSMATSAYLDNGIAIFRDGAGKFFRSDISYKIYESQVNYPKIAVKQTAVRALDVIYTNSDQTRSLFVNVHVNFQTGANALSTAAALVESPVGTSVSGFYTVQAGIANMDSRLAIPFIVRPGSTYRIITSTTLTGVVVVMEWIETYI